MLPKQHRLSAQELEAAAKTAQPRASFKTRYALIRSAPNHKGYNRFAVVLSKRYVRSAARRNALRRIFYDEARRIENTSRDFLMHITPEIAQVRTRDELNQVARELAHELNASFRRAVCP